MGEIVKGLSLCGQTPGPILFVWAATNGTDASDG